MSDAIKGRGSAGNPPNRFELVRYEPFEDGSDDARSAPATTLLRDTSRSIITTNDSPDVGFSASINPCRGCEHGCIYCYARATHEYLGFSAGLDFETKIMVKENAPALLRKELASRKWVPQPLGVCGVTDAYQPIERRLQLTRRCLEVLAEFRNPAWVVTKNRLITRDLAILRQMNEHHAIGAAISVTTLDADLAHVMEPRASTPEARLEAVRELSSAGIPVIVLVAPTIPGLTDHEMPAILTAAREAGAVAAGYVIVRLPHGLDELFTDWLTRHFPEKKDKVLSRIESVRGGKHNDTQFGRRMIGEGPIAEAIKQMFQTTVKKLGFPGAPTLSTAAFRRPGETPTLLFDAD